MTSGLSWKDFFSLKFVECSHFCRFNFDHYFLVFPTNNEKHENFQKCLKGHIPFFKQENWKSISNNKYIFDCMKILMHHNKPLYEYDIMKLDFGMYLFFYKNVYCNYD